MTPVLPTREELTPPAQRGEGGAPRLSVEGDIERAPCALADPAYAAIKVTLTGATFGNLKGATPEELRPLYAAYLGQERPVAVICEIRDAVATYLRRKGYLAAVQVPVQTIENGEVRFEILYARLVAIRVRGDAGRSERLVASYLDKLTRDEVFNSKAAERYLLLARDLPGLDVRLALKSTGKLGELYGDVTVTRTPFEADLNVQNYGPPDTGRWGGQLRAQFNGLTGMGDQTTIAAYTTGEFKEQQVAQFDHEFRVGSEGLRLGGHFLYAWTQPDLQNAPDVLKARTLFANVEARYPFLRSQRASIWGSAGFDYANQIVRFADVDIAEDHVRVVYLGVDGELYDPVERSVPLWRARYSLELRKGLDIFDASDASAGGVPPSRPDGDATAALVRGTFGGEARIVRNLDIALLARGQYAFDRLLAFEEFSAGSFTVGRGYDPGTLIGEDGLGLSGELRVSRIQAFKAAIVFQPYAFVDSAWVWNRGAGGAERLTSVGGGLRAGLDNRFRLDLTLAVPTNKAGLQTQNGPARLLVSFTSRLWPWRSE